MSAISRFLMIALVLQGLAYETRAHQAREDADGCHFEESAYHCHDADADIDGFLAVLATIGVFAYFLCDRVIMCADEGGGDVPETTPQFDATY